MERVGHMVSENDCAINQLTSQPTRVELGKIKTTEQSDRIIPSAFGLLSVDSLRLPYSKHKALIIRPLLECRLLDECYPTDVNEVSGKETPTNQPTVELTDGQLTR